MSDRKLIKSVLEVENFELAKVLLDKIDKKELLTGKRDYYWNTNLEDIGFFDSRKNFNFLANYFFKIGYQKFLKADFTKKSNLCHIINLSNKKNFFRFLQIIPRKRWFSSGCEPLREAISNNDMFIVESLIRIAKETEFDIKREIENGHFSYVLRNNFKTNRRFWKLLKFLNQETGVIGEALIKSLSEVSWYEVDVSDIIKVIRVFKIKEISFSYSTVRNSLKNKKLFFLLYRKTKPEEKKQFFAYNDHSLLLDLLSGSPMLHPDVTKFLLKENLKITNQNNNK